MSSHPSRTTKPARRSLPQADSLDRIINATNLPLSNALSRARLGSELEEVFAVYSVARQMHAGELAAHKMARRLRGVENAAAELFEMLDDGVLARLAQAPEEDGAGLLDSTHAPSETDGGATPPISPFEFVDNDRRTIDELVKAIGRAAPAITRLRERSHWASRAATNEFAHSASGRNPTPRTVVFPDLVAAFELAFERRAAAGRSGRTTTPGGPFVRFCIAFFREVDPGRVATEDEVRHALRRLRASRRGHNRTGN